MKVYFLTHGLQDMRTGSRDFTFQLFFSKKSAIDALEQSSNEENFRKTHEISEELAIECFSSPMSKELRTELYTVCEIWEISEYEVRAKPGERFYALLHYDTCCVRSIDIEVYKTKKAARNHMFEKRCQVEEDMERKMGEMYEYVEWYVDKDWSEVCFGSEVEQWDIQMYKVPL